MLSDSFAHKMKSAAVRAFALVAIALLTLLTNARGQATATLTTLYSFTGGTSGEYLFGALVQDSEGNFYGTTEYGGSSGYGTIFSLSPAGVLTVLHSFTDSSTDGGYPSAGLVLSSDGNFYGTTPIGGSSNDGTAFQITPSGVFTLLHSFTAGGVDGSSPAAALVEGSDGNFYGTTSQGGSNDDGTVFSMTPAGVVTILHSFAASDGGNPVASLVQGSDGNFYGTASNAGTGNHGTVFSITPSGVFTVLYGFTGVGTDGGTPNAGLVLGQDGNFYGTTFYGGANNDGTVFSITPAGVPSTLYSFSSGLDGGNPESVLVQASDGNFYGTAVSGGSSNDGTVFQITPEGVIDTLHSFAGTATDGDMPRAGLVQGIDGNFYGTTSYGGSSSEGTVFELALAPAAGTLQFAAASYNTTENAGSITLAVARTGGSAGAVSVSYSETDGTAYAGLDYQVMSGTLTWADGDSTGKTISIPINDRGITNGGTVSFSVGLTNPGGGATLGTIPTATVNILEEDAAPQPTIAIASPPPGFALISGMTTPVVLSIDDPGGITAQVQFLVNGSVAAEASAPPYSFSFGSSTLGSYTLAAAVTDTQGRVSTSSAVTVNVIAPNANAAPPTSTLLTPVGGRSLAAGSTLTLNVAAAAASTTVLDHVSIYADGVLVATLNANGTSQASTGTGHPTRRDTAAAPGNVFQASYTFPGVNKIVNLVAAAFDVLGQSTVTPVASVQSVVATQAPLVTLAGLVDGGLIQVGSINTVNVNASVAATGSAATHSGRQDAPSTTTLALLEYYINGSKLGKAALPPYSFSFTPPTQGEYVLSAVATDTAGLSTISAPITVSAVASSIVNLAVSGSGEAVEGGSNGVVIVSRTGDTGAPLTVAYKAKGSAVAGVDYKPLAGTVTIPAGSVKAKIKVKPLPGLSAAAKLKLKLLLLSPSDGSYTVGTSPVKIELLGQ